MSTVSFDGEDQRIHVGEWTRRATWVRRTDSSTPRGWSALIGVRRGVNLLVSGHQGGSSIHVEVWVGEPEESDGLAVIVGPDHTLLGTSAIPLCGCGDRGCGNANVQLNEDVEADDLARLIEILEGLDEVHVRPKYRHTWLGGLRDGEPVIE